MGRMPIQQPSHPMKGDVVTNLDFIRKRKISSDFNMMMDQKIYTCEHPQCPYSEVRLGFHDRSARDNHQLNCAYRNSSADYGGGPNFHATEVKPVIFPQSFVQPNTTAQSASLVAPSFDLTGLGVPEDGQKMISDLMTIYDTNVVGNKNLSSTNCVTAENHNLSQASLQRQDSFFPGQGMVLEGNLFAREEGQFDRFKATMNMNMNMNTPFDTNHNNNNIHLMFNSPCDLSSFDFKEDIQGVGMDSLQKQQEVSIWYQ